MRRGLWGALALVLVVGCAPTPVEVDVRFPREENFLFTDFGQLLVFTIDANEGLGDCPALLEQVESSGIGMPALQTGRRPICEFRAGGVSFDDVPPGPHAYVMLAFDDSDNLILDGCTVAEAYVDAPPVQVQLFPTSDYASSTAGRTLTCSSADDKCAPGGGCR